LDRLDAPLPVGGLHRAENAHVGDGTPGQAMMAGVSPDDASPVPSVVIFALPDASRLRADQIARPLLDSRPGTVPGLLADLERHVNANRVLPDALAALDRFGDAGRFYFLDMLASATHTQDAPQTLWTDMTTAIASRDTGLLADLTSAEHYHHGRQRLNDTLAAALTGWWELYVTPGRSGTRLKGTPGRSSFRNRRDDRIGDGFYMRLTFWLTSVEPDQWRRQDPEATSPGRTHSHH
jgi:hypothetical protein